MPTRILPTAAAVITAASLPLCLFAQERARPPRVVSPEVSSERKITFRILAPKAENVRLSGSDIPGLGRGAEMTKETNGVWETTLGPLPPGSYRYHFDVDGVTVIDPRSAATSESNNNTWSLVHVPGAEFMDTRDVPRGAVAEVTYYSKSLQRFRRLHVYTPPGYESGEGKLPVFYKETEGAHTWIVWREYLHEFAQKLFQP